MLSLVEHPYNTRNQFLKYPPARHEYARTNCLYQLIDIINTTPTLDSLAIRFDMIATHSQAGFTIFHKTMILNAYSLDCTITNCYVCHTCS